MHKGHTRKILWCWNLLNLLLFLFHHCSESKQNTNKKPNHKFLLRKLVVKLQGMYFNSSNKQEGWGNPHIRLAAMFYKWYYWIPLHPSYGSMFLPWTWEGRCYMPLPLSLPASQEDMKLIFPSSILWRRSSILVKVASIFYYYYYYYFMPPQGRWGGGSFLAQQKKKFSCISAKNKHPKFSDPNLQSSISSRVGPADSNFLLAGDFVY